MSVSADRLSVNYNLAGQPAATGQDSFKYVISSGVSPALVRTDTARVDVTIGPVASGEFVGPQPQAESEGELTEQETIQEGLDAFVTWVSGFGSSVDDFTSSVPELPFIGASLDSLFAIAEDAAAGVVGSTGDKIAALVQTQVVDAINDYFAAADADPDSFATNYGIIALPGFHVTTSTNLKEFGATVRLASVTQDIAFDLAAAGLGDFGLSLGNISVDLQLAASLDLDFAFGIDDAGKFYVARPEISAKVSLSTNAPFSFEVVLGPLGLGIQDGTVEFDSEVTLGTTATLNLAQLRGEWLVQHLGQWLGDGCL